MTISAKIIKDSISQDGVRITTMQLRYPRYIHPEFMSHRSMSRNSSSSRAIPVSRLIEDIESDEVMPSHWGRNKRGMQAGEEINEPVIVDGKELSREDAWRYARSAVVKVANAVSKAGYHKQVVNRIIENFGHMNVVVTSTEWSNFYALRDHEDAQPEIRELAIAMKKAHNKSTPSVIAHGDWHLPYVTEEDISEILVSKDSSNGLSEIIDDLIKISVARCARVSYLTHDGSKPDIQADIKLYDRLLSSEPLHCSPAEHQATPDIFLGSNYEHNEDRNRIFYVTDPKTKIRKEHILEKQQWVNPKLHGNFKGWIQYRKTLEGESQ